MTGTPRDPADVENDPDVSALAERLGQSRLDPGAAFRGQVRTFLAAVDASGLLIARPRQLWLRVAVCTIVGAALLVLVAAGLSGWGPFAS